MKITGQAKKDFYKWTEKEYGHKEEDADKVYPKTMTQVMIVEWLKTEENSLLYKQERTKISKEELQYHIKRHNKTARYPLAKVVLKKLGLEDVNTNRISLTKKDPYLMPSEFFPLEGWNFPDKNNVKFDLVISEKGGSFQGDAPNILINNKILIQTGKPVIMYWVNKKPHSAIISIMEEVVSINIDEMNITNEGLLITTTSKIPSLEAKPAKKKNKKTLEDRVKEINKQRNDKKN